MTASMGVAFSSCTVPAAGKPTFELSADEMEFGVGIHGEPGRRREKIKSANDLTKEILDNIPMKKFGEPNDIANFVYFLSTNEASYITGQNFHINGGMLMV